MLLELAAANAAFAVIKEAINNSGEIIQAGKAVFDYFDNKAKIQEKITEASDDKKTDIEEFFALEQLKKQEQELKEMLIYMGRPGLWDDWQKFHVQARKKREERIREEIKIQEEKKKRRDNIIYKVLLGFWLTVLGFVVAVMIVGAAWLYTMKGKL
jgi:hypothetical protein